VLALTTLLGSMLPVVASAESPAGQWQIDFTAPAALSVVPDNFADCAAVDIPGIFGSACWSFAPTVDPAGGASGSMTVQYDTDVITGTLTATLYGRVRGRSGTPSQPGGVGSTKAQFGMDLSGSLHFVPYGIDVETESSTRCSGTLAHLPDPADLRCKVKVCVAFDHPQLPGHTVRECAKTETHLTLTPSVVDGGWTLALDVGDDGSGVLSGTATATFRGQTIDYAVTGKYSGTTDIASLSLKSMTPGSSIKIKNLTVSGGQITGGEVGYKLFGHRGRTSLAP
ncbi:MAG: hypothetical protein ACREI8_02300, partial [Myxococcota bacterium]